MHGLGYFRFCNEAQGFAVLNTLCDGIHIVKKEKLFGALLLRLSSKSEEADDVDSLQ